MSGPWEKYGGQSQPMTVGAPNPVRVQQNEQDLTKGNLDIEAKKLDIQRTQLEIDRDKVSNDKAKTGVEQGNAGGFYQRAIRANQTYGTLVVGAPSIGREAAQSVLPHGVVNQFTDPSRQQAEALQDDFVAATLRYESGAAIPPEEMSAQRRRYFPVAGDSPETIRLKETLRQNAIDALKASAGDAAGEVPQIDPRNGEQVQLELQRRLRAGVDPAETIEWLISIGRKPDKQTIAAIIANSGDPGAQTLPPNDPENPYIHALKVGAGDVVEGVGDVLGLVSNPATAAYNWATGSNIRPDLGQNLRDLTGLPEPQTDSENLASAINQGGVTGLGIAGAARAAGGAISGVGQNALMRLGERPLTDAAAGAVGSGASEGTRQAGGGPLAQAVVGLTAGGATVAPANRLNALMMRPQIGESALVRAGKAENVPVNRAMADPDAEARLTAVGKTVVGSRMLQRDAREIGGAIENRVRGLSDGTPLDAPVAGQTVQRAAERSIKQSGQRLGKIYDGLEREVGSMKVPPTKSAQIIDEMISKLSETSGLNGSEIEFLKGLKSDFGKDLSVGALRDARTTLRKKISKGDLVFGQNEKRVLDIMDAAAEDVAAGLTANGKRGAALKFKQVDRQYRERMDFIKNTVQRVIGKRDSNYPPERIIENLKAMATPKGDNGGLGKMMREMSPDERSDIAATFADALGKNGDGQFSTAFLVRHLNRLPTGARTEIFGPEGAKSLENLSVLAQEHKRVTRALGGSPTSLGNDWRSYLLNLVLGAAGGVQTSSVVKGAAVAGAGYAVKAGRDALNAKLLMSKDFTNWLRTAPKTSNPKVINQHFGRLAVIATRNPSISAEIEQFSQGMTRAANENVATGSVAASGNEGPDEDKRADR